MSIYWIDCIYCIHIDLCNLFFNHINGINFINHGVLNCTVMQLKDNSNNPTNSGMTFWGKKWELLEVTGSYCHLRIFHKVCSRNN